MADEPAPDIQYEYIDDGFKIIVNDTELYSYDPNQRVITGLSIKLPECRIESNGIKVGTNSFSGNMIVGYGVGIIVDERGIGMGAPLPEGLAKLTI